MSESQDRHLTLKALSRIHDLPPLRSEQPEIAKTPRRMRSAGSMIEGQGRRSGGVLLRLFEKEVFRW